METQSRPAFGRTKHELLPEGTQLDPFPNDRYHYRLLGFLQRRRGGGGGSSSSSGSSVASSSPSRGSSGSSNSGKFGIWVPWSQASAPESLPSSSRSPLLLGSRRSWRRFEIVAPKADSSSGSSSGSSSSKPSTPKAGPGTGGSSPSTPKSPKIPKLPTPKSGWKPPKALLPGYTPGHPPHHGSGGHLPVGGGGHSHGHDGASSALSCVHPKGMDRLRCAKADAVVGTLFAIIALMLVPLLIYLCIMRYKRRKSAAGNRHEEDGMELTHGVVDCGPGPQADRGVSDGASSMNLASSTSQESTSLAKEQTQDRSSGSSPGQKPPPIYQPASRSVSRGRKLSRRAYPVRCVKSSLSSGMIRTAMLGQTLQDTQVIDVLPSLASSKKASERKRSGSDVDGSSGSAPHADGKRRCSEDAGHGCVDRSVEDGDRHEDIETRSTRSRSSSHKSSSHVSEQRNEDEGRPDHAGSRCSSRRASSRGPDHQPDHEMNAPDDTAS